MKPPVKPKPKRDAEAGASVTVINQSVSKAAKPARVRRRHWGVILSFFLLVLGPSAGAAYYMFYIAADQYSSRVSFSIRSEEIKNPLEAISSIGQLSTGSSSDASILNEYIRSQKLVEDISANLDLEAIYSKPEYDPIFAFEPGAPIEEMVDYWRFMTYVAYDSGTGLIDIEAFAFTSEDAHVIANAIMDASSNLVDQLSRIAREDTTKHAEYELERARKRLEDARVALGELRDREQIIDPQVDLESQMGVLTALQQQLAAAVIEYDLLVGTTRAGDPRLVNISRKIEAIEDRIVQERNKIGQETRGGNQALATVVGNYESLFANREFAEHAYTASAAAYDAALAEARRKSRYLAAHIPPTRAESSQYPSRALISLGFFGSALLFWIIATLTVYAMWDRR